MLYAVSLCNVEPCIASWTLHVLWKISNLLDTKSTLLCTLVDMHS